MQNCDGKHQTLDELFNCEECTELFEDCCQECGYGDGITEIHEACADCIGNYIDGKQQLEEDNYREDN